MMAWWGVQIWLKRRKCKCIRSFDLNFDWCLSVRLRFISVSMNKLIYVIWVAKYYVGTTLEAEITWMYCLLYGFMTLYTLRPRQNGRHFPDDIFKWIFLNENIRISITISLKFVPGGPISNIPTLVQVMAWRRPGDKPLSEPMMFRLPTHICVTRPQWVNSSIL